MKVKVDLKSRVSHKTVTDFMKKRKPWHGEAIAEMGWQGLLVLTENLAPEDNNLICKLLRNSEIDKEKQTLKLHLYNKRYTITAEDFRRYMGLGNGRQPVALEPKVTPDQTKKWKDYLGTLKEKGTLLVAGDKCDVKLAEFLEMEDRPTNEEEVLKFQKTFFWLVTIDLLMPTVTRHVTNKLLNVTLEQIRDWDWPNFYWQHFLKLAMRWKDKSTAELKAQRKEKVQAALGKTNEANVVGVKRRAGVHNQPKKKQKLSKTTASEVADTTEGESCENEEVQPQSNTTVVKRDHGRIFCGGCVYFLQLWYYEHIKAAEDIAEADFPLAKWTAENYQTVYNRISVKIGDVRTKILHPQELIGDDGEEVGFAAESEEIVEDVVDAGMGGDPGLIQKQLEEVEGRIEQRVVHLEKTYDTLKDLVNTKLELIELKSKDVGAGNVPMKSKVLSRKEIAANKKAEDAAKQQQKLAMEEQVNKILKDSLKQPLKDLKTLRTDFENFKTKRERLDESVKAPTAKELKVLVADAVAAYMGSNKDCPSGPDTITSRLRVRAGASTVSTIDENHVKQLVTKGFKNEKAELEKNLLYIVGEECQAVLGDVEYELLSQQQRLWNLECRCNMYNVDEELELEIAEEFPHVDRERLMKALANFGVPFHWPEVDFEDMPFVKTLVHYIWENNSGNQMDSLEPVGKEETLFLFPDMLRPCGGTLYIDSQIIDLIGHYKINSVRIRVEDDYCVPMLFSQAAFKWMESTTDEGGDDFLKDQLAPIWHEMKAAREIYLPIYTVEHFFLCLIRKDKKVVEIWDTQTENREGHERHVKALMDRVAPLIARLDSSREQESNWGLFRPVNMHSSPRQECK